MSIIRLGQKTHNFAILDKAFLENPKLSWRAKGLLAYLLSRKEDWQVRVIHLTSCSKDGRDANYKAISELESAGYISRECVKNAKGRIERYDYVVFEKPSMDNPLPAFQEMEKNGVKPQVHPLPGFPDTEIPDTDFPDREKPTLVSNEFNKNEINKDRQTKEQMSACSSSTEEKLIGPALT